MSEFKVDTKALERIAAELDNIKGGLSRTGSSVTAVRNNLHIQIAQRERINSRLMQASREIERHERGMSQLSRAASNIALTYQRTEKTLCGETTTKHVTQKPGHITVAEWFSKIISDIHFDKIIGAIVSTIITPKIDKLQKEFTNSVNSALSGDIFDKSYNKSTGFKGVVDPLTGKIIKAETELDEEAFDEAWNKGKIDKEVKIWSKKGEISGAMYEQEGSFSSDNASWSGSVQAMQGSLYGNIEVTDKQIGANMGASFSALSAEQSGQLGSEYFNVHEEASVEFMSGSVGVGGTIGLGGAALDASAELVLAQATGKAGVTVMGTDVDVSGSVQVGVGAHANAQIKDGKILLDVGASLGIGASVKLEVDVSGTVNAVRDKVKEWLKWW